MKWVQDIGEASVWKALVGVVREYWQELLRIWDMWGEGENTGPVDSGIGEFVVDDEIIPKIKLPQGIKMGHR